MKVRNVMTETPFCCLRTDSLQRVAELMRAHDIGSVPVVADGVSRTLVGIVTDRDICMFLTHENKTSTVCTAGEAMSTTLVVCHPEHSLKECEQLMQHHQLRRIPLVDDADRCIGIISQADIALHDSSEHTSETVAAISRRLRTRHKSRDHSLMAVGRL